MQQEPLEAFAAAAHDLWRDRMLREGWRHGARYNPADRLHDALVPFDRLDPVDREHAIEGAKGCTDVVVRAVAPLRGPCRQFRLSEMHVGMGVGLASGVQVEGIGDPRTARGRIIAWSAGERPEQVGSVTVEWPGGIVTEHDPRLHDLRRLDHESN